MGLKNKAGRMRRILEAAQKLEDVVGKAGTVDLDYAAQSIGTDGETVLSAALRLEKIGAIKIRSFMGKVEFIPLNEVKLTGDIEDLIDLIEQKKRIEAWKAAAHLKVPVNILLEWCRILEADNIVRIQRRLLRNRMIEGNEAHILKHRINQGLTERRKTKRVIYTAVDYLLELAKELGNIGLNEAAAVTGLGKKELEYKVAQLHGLLSLEYPLNFLAPPRIKVCEIKKSEGEGISSNRVLGEYEINASDVPAKVNIEAADDEPTLLYRLLTPEVGDGTKAILKSLRKDIRDANRNLKETVNQDELKTQFTPLSIELVKKNFVAGEQDINVLSGMLLHDSVGMGNIEYLMNDDCIEKISVNTADMQLTAYHKRFGWVKTNLLLEDEENVYNCIVGNSGKISLDDQVREPIIEAQLPGGDKLAATLYPLSTLGTTITISKFARQPWTMTHYLIDEVRTLSLEMAAFLWMCVQYELNIIVCGPQASGKTSMLNSLSCLMQSSHRIISVEDNREINLPKSMRWSWTALTRTNAPQRFRDKITVTDLLEISLRMKPDRVIFNEIKEPVDAAAFFEAMRTQSTYSTMHADTAQDLKTRLIGPPIGLAENVIDKLQLIVVVTRDRKSGRRRVTEITEVLSTQDTGLTSLNCLYMWDSYSEGFRKVNDSIRVRDELRLHAGMDLEDINKDLTEKETVLKWMVDNKITGLDPFGGIMSEYYRNPAKMVEKVTSRGVPSAHT